jgi:hypothetical protein
MLDDLIFCVLAAPAPHLGGAGPPLYLWQVEHGVEVGGAYLSKIAKGGAAFFRVSFLTFFRL